MAPLFTTLSLGRGSIRVFVLCIVSGALSVRGQPEEGTFPSIERIVALDETQIWRDHPVLKGIAETPQAMQEVMEHWAEAKAPEGRVKVVSAIVAMRAKDPGPIRCLNTRLALDSATIGVLVNALSDPSVQVRKEALRTLVYQCADSAVTSRGHDIVAALQGKPTDVTDAIRLLGMTHCQEARRLLREDPLFSQKCDARNRDLTLAKLGDAQLEQQFVTAFLHEESPEKQIRLAAELGYLGTPGAVAALASQMRSPVVLYWGAGKSALRVFLVDALCRALPENELFWRPAGVKWTDERYQRIEEWAEAVMQVRWDHGRPPFLYEFSFPDQ